MKYKVVIDGAELKDSPIGIQALKSSFKRDTDLKGVFIEELIELRFVGDGYCKLQQLQQAKSKCDFPVLVYKICKGVQSLTFNGIAETFSIKLDVDKSEATVRVLDNSPLNRILQNKDSIYYPTSTTALDGVTVIDAAQIRSIDFEDAAAASPTADWEDIEVYEAMELLQGNLNWIVPNSLTVVSDFFNRTYGTEIAPLLSGINGNNYRRTYDITYGAVPTINAVTTIKYRNFYGIEVTEVITGIGAETTHLEHVWTTLLKFASINNLSEQTQFGYDYDYQEWDYGANPTTTTIVLRSFFDNVILSMECDETTVTFQLNTTDATIEYIDSGNNTCFLTGKMLRKAGSDNFNATFKWIIEELDKLYNITFLVQNGEFIIEDEQSFQTGDIILTIDNATELMVASSLENIYSKIAVSDKGLPIKPVIERDFISKYCGVEKSYDAETESIKSWANIWNDIANPDENNDDNYYVVQGQSAFDTASMTETQPTLLVSSRIIVDNGSFAYILNGQIVNNRQVIRHFPKFVNDLTVSPFAIVTNDDRAELLEDISFKAVITDSQYKLLINNNLDNVKVKSKYSDYYIGITQQVDYDYTSGEATFLISGKKL